jgi:hypothetical protein
MLEAVKGMTESAKQHTDAVTSALSNMPRATDIKSVLAYLAAQSLAANMLPGAAAPASGMAGSVGTPVLVNTGVTGTPPATAMTRPELPPHLAMQLLLAVLAPK